ncbi:hypothetical protein EJ08DRAFT_583063, partial [Tothia fuscella]
IARDSKRIAVKSQQDSSAMKTVALLTIAFLPGTFVAALFSTGLFKFKLPSDNQILSPQFWVYWAITIPLTVIVFVFWKIWFMITRFNVWPQTLDGDYEVVKNGNSVVKVITWPNMNAI